jgi:hypothetical protein
VVSSKNVERNGCNLFQGTILAFTLRETEDNHKKLSKDSHQSSCDSNWVSVKCRCRALPLLQPAWLDCKFCVNTSCDWRVKHPANADVDLMKFKGRNVDISKY